MFFSFTSMFLDILNLPRFFLSLLRFCPLWIVMFLNYGPATFLDSFVHMIIRYSNSNFGILSVARLQPTPGYVEA